MLIDVNKLVANSYNPNSMSDLKFNALVKSIKEEDWNRLFPIEVMPEENGEYVIIDWEHRHKALIEAGIEKAHIEVSHLKDWYEKLRTISKNSIHWTHDQVEEATLVAEIKQQGITDSEIMESIGIDEKELIAIDNLTSFDISDFDNEVEIPEEEKDDEIEDIKEVDLVLSEAHYNILNELKEITKAEDIQEAIMIAASYFQLNSETIDPEVLKIVKGGLFWIEVNTKEVIDF